MTDDPSEHGPEDDGSDRVKMIPIPWTLELGSTEDTEGNIWGIFDIYTFQGHTRLFHEPDFGIQMSNYWHNASVKTKARQQQGGGKKLIVAQADLAGLDLPGTQNRDNAERRP